MHSTLKPRDSDPHDIFLIAPEAVPAAWADKVLADITSEAKSEAKSPLDVQSAPPDFESPASATGTASGTAAPKVDTTFRAIATEDIPAVIEQPTTGRWAKSAVMLVLAICSAAAAAAWQNHGDAAKQMISNWVPAFAVTSSPPAETAALPGQTDTPAAQASVAEQTPAPPAAPAQPPESAVTAAEAPSPDTTQLQVMARDLAAMAQQVEQLKASIAELKTSQQAMVRDAVRTSEVKPAEIKPAAPNPRPKTAAPPPRTAAAPPHRPMPSAQAYPPAQAAAPAPLPQPAYPPVSTAPPRPQDTARADDDGPIVRPPMSLLNR
ncbi:MAG: hypothetical protein JWR80_5414 [Bradyrhizobium sp.]|nr:hypothetical protein [Bradyrhizobium sp.]